MKWGNKMPDLQDIRREALNEIIKNIKVMTKACYPNNFRGILDCENCKNQKICNAIFGAATPKFILNELKEGTH